MVEPWITILPDVSIRVSNMISQLSLDFATEQATADFGRRLAAVLQPGDVIGLIGPLGAGKTRLVKALAAALDVPANLVNSPTFTLIQEYAGRLPIRHCDAYRLKNPAEFRDLGLDELFAADGVALIEWADRVMDELPDERLEIRLEPVSLTARRANLTGHGIRGVALIELCAAARY